MTHRKPCACSTMQKKCCWSSPALCPWSLNPHLVCFVQIDQERQTHPAAGQEPGTLSDCSPASCCSFSSFAYLCVTVRTHMFCCHNKIWHINNSAEEKKASPVGRHAGLRLEQMGPFLTYPPLLIQSDGSEEWCFAGEVKLEDNLVYYGCSVWKYPASCSLQKDAGIPWNDRSHFAFTPWTHSHSEAIVLFLQCFS